MRYSSVRCVRLPRVQGHVVVTLFYEESTRTCCSFQSAALRLGGGSLPLHPQYSSAKKGETLEGIVQVFIGIVSVLI